MFDWRREAIRLIRNTTIGASGFSLRLYKHGLAYRKMSPVDWCPNCNTTLAGEQVWEMTVHCERCTTPVIKKKTWSSGFSRTPSMR